MVRSNIPLFPPVKEPYMSLEVVSAIIFALAIIHVFSVKYFESLARKCEKHAGLLHLFGEIEVVFGIWAMVLMAFMFAIAGKGATIEYIDSRNYTETMFVFVIMVISATRPILQSVVLFVKKLSNALPRKGATAFYFVVMCIVPLLGSLITEPAAMTLAALILSDKLFSQGISERLKYITLGTLFINISVGGTLTNFAAPPILMVAGTWEWSSYFMFTNFGWKAMVATLLNTLLVISFFYKELSGISIKSATQEKESIPFPIVLTHFVFLFLVIYFSHYPPIFMSIFLLFLGITYAYQRYQDRLMLREGLLVAFFIGGLVLLGGQQEWWLKDILGSLGNMEAFIGAIVLGPFTDNAAITYLASLVSGLSDEFKYSLVTGAVTSGGLTVIANAPNPAGVAILKNHFEDGAISARGLALGGLLPTTVAALCFLIL